MIKSLHGYNKSAASFFSPTFFYFMLQISTESENKQIDSGYSWLVFSAGPWYKYYTTNIHVAISAFEPRLIDTN